MLNNKLTSFFLIAICAALVLTINKLSTNHKVHNTSFSPEQTEQLELDKTLASQIEPLAEISEFDEVIQRPLFSSTRQPEKIEESAPEQRNTPILGKKPSLKLAGIVLSDEEKIALIKDRRKKKLQRIKLNETIDGWKLIKIESNSVELESRGQKITLNLTRNTDPTRTKKRSTDKKSIPASSIPPLPIEFEEEDLYDLDESLIQDG